MSLQGGKNPRPAKSAGGLLTPFGSSALAAMRQLCAISGCAGAAPEMPEVGGRAEASADRRMSLICQKFLFQVSQHQARPEPNGILHFGLLVS